MKQVKKIIPMLMAGALMLTSFPVYAVDNTPIQPLEAEAIEIVPYATNTFSGSTGTMNSLNGMQSGIWPISSPTISSTSAKVTGVSLSVTVSSGSDSFDLYVMAPDGTTNSTSVGKSGTYTISGFSNVSPKGTWYVYIKNKPLIYKVSTATARMTVTYSY